jgi:hypothetical protein
MTTDPAHDFDGIDCLGCGCKRHDSAAARHCPNATCPSCRLPYGVKSPNCAIHNVGDEDTTIAEVSLEHQCDSAGDALKITVLVEHVRDLLARCRQLEWAHAEAMALVFSHEGHIAKLEAKVNDSDTGDTVVLENVKDEVLSNLIYGYAAMVANVNKRPTPAEDTAAFNAIHAHVAALVQAEREAKNTEGRIEATNNEIRAGDRKYLLLQIEAMREIVHACIGWDEDAVTGEALAQVIARYRSQGLLNA